MTIPTRTPPSTTHTDHFRSALYEARGNRRALNRLSQQLSTPEAISSFLSLDWSGIYDAYRDVLLALASRKPASISQILAGLVERLGREEEEGAVGAIQSLIRLAPSCSNFLIPTIEFYFPFHTRSILEHVVYIGNLLKIAEMMPMWKFKILELIIGKALIIDVELQNDSEQLKNMDLCKETTTCAEESEPSQVDFVEPEAEHLKRKKKLRAVRTGTKKLDRVLELLFSHVDRLIRRNTGDLDEVKSREMFSFMLNVFEKTILPTFKSRYTQFLTFYMTSLRPNLADQFLGLLFKPLVQFCQSLDHGRNSMPNPKLLLSVTYIGSFVARARFLSDELLQSAFEMLIDLSTRLRLKTTIGSPKILSVISLQHIMYIFCQRYHQLVSLMGNQELEDLFDILLEDDSILQFCNSEIVIKFIDLAGEKLGLIHPEIAIEYERGRAAAGKFVTKYEDLEFYFPFDPIALIGCKNFINKTVYQDDESESEDEDEGREWDENRKGGESKKKDESQQEDEREGVNGQIIDDEKGIHVPSIQTYHMGIESGRPSL